MVFILEVESKESCFVWLSTPEFRRLCQLSHCTYVLKADDNVFYGNVNKYIPPEFCVVSGPGIREDNEAMVLSKVELMKNLRSYVKQDAKLVQLLECLQKSPPPFVIFSENKLDVDNIHDYLLLKGVDAVAIHGGKDQQERDYAIKAFKSRNKDVLVATDVALKGLDFPDIQHVINYDMPAEIGNYVHRIGRTRRFGNTGTATTFINNSQSETTLLDQKHLLLEANQRVPPVLALLDFQTEEAATGCAYCGGLGHRTQNYLKLEHQNKQLLNPKHDYYFGGGGYRAEI
ncbi:DEAD-box ATP-dependent RNA helicase 35-like [Chenopodium quinoa]|uniref:DEAD-box ATP-dependent RNA helicase 35-like n=1 Tax=Chenopodium quinoa TaxID=63459 RepID=UPI000B77AE17|nr:DEAD-box ATP-dependent RNA helicase 35-like [Chenopodium quinoa]